MCTDWGTLRCCGNAQVLYGKMKEVKLSRWPCSDREGLDLFAARRQVFVNVLVPQALCLLCRARSGAMMGTPGS